MISIAAVLLLANCVTQLFRFGLDHGHVYGLVPLFDLDRENNIPTFFSSGLWLLASALTAATAVTKRRRRDHFAGRWTTLAILFLYLAVDEASSIHELLIEPTRTYFGASGFFYFAWVIPAIVLLPLLAAFYRRFVFSLASRTRYLFLLGAVIYVCGALGMELIGGNYADSRGYDGLTYALFASLEEALEMVGIIVFLYALLDYMMTDGVEVRFRIGA